MGHPNLTDSSGLGLSFRRMDGVEAQILGINKEQAGMRSTALSAPSRQTRTAARLEQDPSACGSQMWGLGSPHLQRQRTNPVKMTPHSRQKHTLSNCHFLTDILLHWHLTNDHFTNQVLIDRMKSTNMLANTFFSPGIFF